jgi:hypothetical protein
MADGSEQVMKTSQSISRRVCRWALALLVLFVSPLPLVGQLQDRHYAPAASLGQLNIEGKSITNVTLVDDRNQTLEFPRPGPTVSLPAGKYRLQEVQLQDGFRCYQYGLSEDEWFRISTERPHQVRLGVPLKPTIKATRQGRLLKLGYELLDADGRNYTNQQRVNPPQFTVYKDGEEIGSGSFEYG